MQPRRPDKSVVCHGGCVTTLECGSRSAQLREYSGGNADRQPGESGQLGTEHYEDTRQTMDPSLEMERRVESLRSLVCDLLKTNQELREALYEARSGGGNVYGASPEKTSDAKF